MRNVAADKRADSLKLKPAKKQTNPLCKVVISPAYGLIHNMEIERAMRCKGFGGRR